MGLVALIIGVVTPWTTQADDGWADGRQFELSESSAGSVGAAAADRSLGASLTPGSVVIAQAGGTDPEAAAEEW